MKEEFTTTVCQLVIAEQVIISLPFQVLVTVMSRMYKAKEIVSAGA